jgi:hypothetical protein
MAFCDSYVYGMLGWPGPSLSRASALSFGQESADKGGVRAERTCTIRLLRLGLLCLAGAGCRGAQASDFTAAVDPDRAAACAERGKLVYVLSEGLNTLYSFDPAKLKFTKIGTPRCLTSATVNSMTIDRWGTAWINYREDGKIYKVDTQTLACEETTFEPGGGIGFSHALSLSFSSDDPWAGRETLYVGDNSDERNPRGGKGMAVLHPGTMKLVYVGPFSGDLARHQVEFTGTGDSRLFGFFPLAEKLGEIDKKTSAIRIVRRLSGVHPADGAFAFSFWAGYFWLYTNSIPGQSTVTRYDWRSGEEKVVIEEAGFVIVGAGVSTCAPVKMPSTG